MRKRTGATLAALGLIAAGLVAGASLATGRSVNEAGETASSGPHAGQVARAGRITDSDAASESSNADDDGTEQPITGPDLDRAIQVALDHVGQGRVTHTEVEDEESYYEVEVTLNDGRQVDVQLDHDFTVLDQTADEDDE